MRLFRKKAISCGGSTSAGSRPPLSSIRMARWCPTRSANSRKKRCGRGSRGRRGSESALGCFRSLGTLAQRGVALARPRTIPKIYRNRADLLDQRRCERRASQALLAKRSGRNEPVERLPDSFRFLRVQHFHQRALVQVADDVSPVVIHAARGDLAAGQNPEVVAKPG